MSVLLTPYAKLVHCSEYLHLDFVKSHQVVSSAVFNGGMVQADHIVNLKVAKDAITIEPPEITLSHYCKNSAWHGKVVGMMTAASMDSFRLVKQSAEGVDIVALVTTGLSNVRRVGDRAEYRHIADSVNEVGTINLIILTSAKLTDAAMIEALLIATEAKSAALQEAGILSPISNKIATGTGTDAIAVVNGHGEQQVSYCGKHVLFGELLGKAVFQAVTSSIGWQSIEQANLTKATIGLT
ncbi:hypothetical protein tinsulaeT_03240 [Thalassotalea insulae]|uniref:Adenosylcobinamide amidohydrolase n=1 Tax=Thalassotalea insulae TaxID=2056778 RepID=A0ABQ6GNW3_9GAMM|nr:adenosylcobinamide amidohydrolase [Thalassotalea insulae]GLX76984.1 hypothetical protein tinsulaeT_03240 [Thalassotalea insulae]